MTRSKSLNASVLALALTSILSGCATMRGLEPERSSEDAEIRANIHSMLDQRSDIVPNTIQVQSIDRVVYLTGLVDTSAEKWIAESIARRARGVARVVNSIEQSN